jgi:hypothetical protein
MQTLVGKLVSRRREKGCQRFAKTNANRTNLHVDDPLQTNRQKIAHPSAINQAAAISLTEVNLRLQKINAMFSLI